MLEYAGEAFLDIALPNHKISRKIFTVLFTGAMTFWFLIVPLFGLLGLREQHFEQHVLAVQKQAAERKKQEDEEDEDQQQEQHGSKTLLPPPLVVTYASYVKLLIYSMIGFLVTILFLMCWFNPNNHLTSRGVFVVPFLSTTESNNLIQRIQATAQRNVKQQQGRTNHMDWDELLHEPKGYHKRNVTMITTTTTDSTTKILNNNNKKQLCWCQLNWQTDPFTIDDRTWLTKRLQARLAPTLRRVYGVTLSSIHLQDMVVHRYDHQNDNDDDTTTSSRSRRRTSSTTTNTMSSSSSLSSCCTSQGRDRGVDYEKTNHNNNQNKEIQNPIWTSSTTPSSSSSLPNYYDVAFRLYLHPTTTDDDDDAIMHSDATSTSSSSSTNLGTTTTEFWNRFQNRAIPLPKSTTKKNKKNDDDNNKEVNILPTTTGTVVFHSSRLSYQDINILPSMRHLSKASTTTTTTNTMTTTMVLVGHVRFVYNNDSGLSAHASYFDLSWLVTRLRRYCYEQQQQEEEKVQQYHHHDQQKKRTTTTKFGFLAHFMANILDFVIVDLIASHWYEYLVQPLYGFEWQQALDQAYDKQQQEQQPQEPQQEPQRRRQATWFTGMEMIGEVERTTIKDGDMLLTETTKTKTITDSSSQDDEDAKQEDDDEEEEEEEDEAEYDEEEDDDDEDDDDEEDDDDDDDEDDDEDDATETNEL